MADQHLCGSELLKGQITLSGDITELSVSDGLILTGNSISTAGYVTLNKDFIMWSCLSEVLDRQFKNRSESFRTTIKELFRNKNKEECLDAIINQFSNDNVEFFDDMADEEIINFIRISY